MDPSASLRDAERYRFLASAVAGRGISVHFSVGSETLAFSDGQSILLPPQAGDDDADAWAQVSAQAALIAAGSLNVPALRALLGRRPLAQRYTYLEVLRATRLIADRLPWAFSQRAELRDAPMLSDSAAASLALALSRHPLPATPAYFGTIKPLMALRRTAGDEGLMALTRRQQQGDFKLQPAAELDEDDEGEESRLLKLFQNPLTGGSPLSDLLAKLLGAGAAKGKREQDGSGDSGAEIPVGRVERALRRGVHAVMARLPFELPELDLQAEPASRSYPEWDAHSKAYKPDWVFVEEVEPWRADGPQDLGSVLVAPSAELRRQLARLGLDHQLHRRQNEGSDLDVGALIDCAIDLRTGHSPSTPPIYRASRRTRRDLAVVIVLDISGSTAEKNNDAASVFHQQMQTAYQLGQTLNGLGDTVAMFGFHSWGRKLVRAVRIKGHDEIWSGRVAERLAQLEPVGYTRTGTAIRHGTHLLTNSVRLPNRLLLLITDGIAYDHDYEQAYAEGDARKALEEARAAGTACVCLSVASGTQNDKLLQLFGSASMLAVDEPAQITGRIRDVCRQALAAVSKRKFSIVRNSA